MTVSLTHVLHEGPLGPVYRGSFVALSFVDQLQPDVWGPHRLRQSQVPKSLHFEGKKFILKGPNLERVAPEVQLLAHEAFITRVKPHALHGAGESPCDSSHEC